MENLNIKVNNEDESKESQDLLFELGGDFYFGGKLYCNTHLGLLTINKDGLMANLELDGFDYKEITLPQLRDMVVLKRNDRKDATHYRSDGKEYFHDKSTDCFYHFQDDSWVLSTWMNSQLLPQLKPIEKKEMKEKEYLELQDDGSCDVVLSYRKEGESWIEVPDGAEILYFDKRYKPSNHFFKTVDGNSYYKYLENDSKWMKYNDEGLNEFKENIDNFCIVWQRSPTTTNTLIQDKLKFIEKWLNGDKIQYILGIESDKSQWHNFTEGAMRYIKRPDIKFREAPKYATINGIEFKSVDKLVKYVKNNFDLEDDG